MGIQQSIRGALKLFSAQPILYLLIGAVVAYGSLVTFGILSGPLIGGFVQVALVHQRTGRRPGFGDLVAGFQNLGNLFLLSLVIFLCWTGIGILLPPLLLTAWWAYVPLFILIIALATWWMYAPVLIVDQRMSLRRAMQKSRAHVTGEGGFFSHLGFLLCVFILPPAAVFGLSGVFPLASLLNFIVCPLQFLALTCAYEQDFVKEPGLTGLHEEEGRP
jgi:uncharacterized membrane protein YqaE (UPF0057 family)